MSQNQNANEEKTCIVCGDSMNALKEPVVSMCDFCGRTARISYECHNMHYICDSCMSMPVIDYVKSVCLKHKGIDPMALAVEVMNSPLIKMHGPGHHFIVPAVLLTCTHNAFSKPVDLDKQLEVAEHRAKCETPDKCTHSHGNCGAAHGAGVFVSMYLDRDPSTEDMWSLTNSVTASALKRIADYPGPRCCKRDTYLAIQATVEFMKEKFALELPMSEAKCTFSLRNSHCGREECVFFNMANSLA